jgi:hypothetical protein
MDEELRVTHGTLYAYVGHKCRCPACTDAMRRYSQHYRGTEKGAEKTRISSQKSNYIRQRCVDYMKVNHPDMVEMFSSTWDRKSIIDRNNNGL